MKPYFEINHLAGLLLMIATMSWGAMELAKASNTREGATSALLAALGERYRGYAAQHKRLLPLVW